MDPVKICPIGSGIAIAIAINIEAATFQSASGLSYSLKKVKDKALYFELLIAHKLPILCEGDARGINISQRNSVLSCDRQSI
jgi:hypothetical protein